MLRLSPKTHFIPMILFVIGVISGCSEVALARSQKLAFSAGGFSFDAQNQSNRVQTSISGFGSYQVAYRHEVFDRIEFDAGYSMLATEIIAGDLAFGLDVGMNYYPLTAVGREVAQTDTTSLIVASRFRPFVGLGFHQRSFQSTSTQYAGFGGKIGTDYEFSDQWQFTVSIRYLNLIGPNQSSATQIDTLLGLLLHF